MGNSFLLGVGGVIKANVCLKKLVNPMTLIALIGFIVLSYLYLDKPLADWLFSLNLQDKYPILTWVTCLGNMKIYLILLFVLALLCRYGQQVGGIGEQRAWFLLLCVALSNAVCGVLKVSLGRARPDLWLNHHEYGFSWFQMDKLHMSFPSGHTTTIMSLVFGLSVLFPRYWAAFIFAGVLVTLSRVLLLQHYLSDVVAAMYVTLVVVIALVAVFQKKGWLSKIWLKNKRV